MGFAVRSTAGGSEVEAAEEMLLNTSVSGSSCPRDKTFVFLGALAALQVYDSARPPQSPSWCLSCWDWGFDLLVFNT